MVKINPIFRLHNLWTELDKEVLIFNTDSDDYPLRRIWFSYCRLWFFWVLANLVNEALGQLSFLTLPMFGFCQWLVLRNYIRHFGWWILASVYSWITTYLIIFGFQAGTRILEIAPEGELVVIGVSINIQLLWVYVLLSLLESAIVGVFQWLVLRNRISHAGWWICASSMGGIAKGVVLAVVLPVEPTFAKIISSLGYGAVSGIGLVWLLKTWIKHRLKREIYPN